MKRWLLLLFVLALLCGHPSLVRAQNTQAGITPCAIGLELDASITSANVQLNACGPTVIVWNIGTQDAFLTWGTTSATAATTTSGWPLPAGSAVTLNSGRSALFLAAITASSTTTLRIMQGNGMPSLSGGSGGSGSGGGAVTIANGADVTQGAIADTAYAGSGNSTVVSALKGIYSAAVGAIPAGTNRIGYVSDDPCQTIAKTYTPISITTNTTTRIVAPTSAKKTYVCYLFLTSAAADNVAIIEGTGGTCGSGTAGVIGGATAANGPNFAANGGMSIGNGGFTVTATAGTNVDLCLITSAATPLAGTIAWVQAP